MVRNLLVFCTILWGNILNGQHKFLDPVFSQIDIFENIVYGQNISVNDQDTINVDLTLDLYFAPDNNSASNPLIILVHSGFLLPSIKNSLLIGTNRDSSIVESAHRLAKLGYRVASIDYRLGWNNHADDFNIRNTTFIQALYRAVQDTRTAIRFFKDSYQNLGNPFLIDTSRIGVWGYGIGALVTSLAAYQSNEAVWLSEEFSIDQNNDNIPDPVISFAHFGNSHATSWGINPTGDTLSYINYPEFSSGFQISVACQGTLPDTNWINSDGIPGIYFHVATDPVFPIDEFFIIDPVTGDPKITAMGSRLIVHRLKNLSVNEVFSNAQLNDPISVIKHQSGIHPEGFCPLNTPFESDNAPWDWWNPEYWSTIEHPFCSGAPPPACSFHTIGLFSNPNVSAAKGNTYIDTMIQYFIPRAILALDLEVSVSINSQKPLPVLNIFPNPNYGVIHVNADLPLTEISLYNHLGQPVSCSIQNTSPQQVVIRLEKLIPGIYYIKIYAYETTLVRKVLIN